MSFRQRTVIGTVVDAKGIPIKSGTVTFKLTLPLGYTATHTIVDRIITTVTNDDGEFSVPLWCDEDSTVAIDYEVLFPIVDEGSSDQAHSDTFSLFYGTTSINISDLTKDALEGSPWGWYSADEITDDSQAAAIWRDRTLNGNDLSTYMGSPPAQLIPNVINGLPVLRFNGLGQHAYRGLSTPITFRDIFIVMMYRDATFQVISRMCLGDISTEVLIGNASATTWLDQSIPGLEYRKDGALFASNNMQAPMNVFSVMHLRFTAGRAFNGVLNLANSISQGYPCPVDIAEFILYSGDENIPEETYEYRTFQLMKKYGIS